MVVLLHGFMKDLVTAVIAELIITLFFCLSRVNYPYFHSGNKRYFLCSSLSIMLCNGVSIRKYEAYWHINFSLINGCGNHENNICGHSFF